MEEVLWQAQKLNCTIGSQVIFDDAQISIHRGERLGVVGRNGAGKTTLLRVMRGELLPADAKISAAKNLRISILPQLFELDRNASIAENVRSGMGSILAMLREFETLPPASRRHEELEHQLLLLDAWNCDETVAMLGEKLHLGDLSRSCTNLSGGELRRVSLAAAIAGKPDLLLLDEPTNHLDIETIQWIEDFMADYRGTCLFVTHDRTFLDRLATRIVELDHGKFYSYDGSYADFITGKAEREYAEDQLEAKRRKFLRSEIEWVRRSPKARLKRNLGRVRRFEETSAISAPVRDAEMDLVIPAPRYLGNKSVEFKHVSLSLGGKTLFRDFDFEFLPGCHLGIVGGNGVGKTTLLRLLTGMMRPDSGTVSVAPAVEFNYVDQNKVRLDPEKRVIDEISGGVETIELGREKISVWGYLRRFLFEDERINTQIKYLSGGEKARLTLAKQLKEGGNFLLLDEPTNDLDLPSLRVLEEALAAFPGCMIVVSHDRYFINRVCDNILVCRGDGRFFSTPGDFDYAYAKLHELDAEQKTPAPAKPAAATAAVPAPVPRPKAAKLSFKEQRELDGMESAIAEAEERHAELEAAFGAADFFQRYGDQAAAMQREFEELKTRIDALYSRWEELESRAK